MNRLILHIGPGKCGSTTIQANLAPQSAKSRCFGFVFLDPKLVNSLSAPPTAKEDIVKFESLLATQFNINSSVILSNELIFDKPSALDQMLKIARNYTSDIRIVGYSRRPSSHLQSRYCQWDFRDPNKAKETWKHLIDAGFAPEVFSGLERLFVAAITTGFHASGPLSGKYIYNWKKRYDQIEDIIAPYDAKLSVGRIPCEEDKFSLIEDFYLLSDLQPGSPVIDTITHANPQFDLDIVEAVQIAVIQGLQMPNPNQDNRYFEDFSHALPCGPASKNALLDILGACVDGMWWNSNQNLANSYGFDPISMRPRLEVEVESALLAAHREQDQRLQDPRAFLSEQTRIIGRLAKFSFEVFRQL